MSLLDRKLLRDLVAMRSQVLTIALVVAAGIAVFTASISVFETLRGGRDSFYAANRFPQLFASIKRAPLSLVPQLSAIEGVAHVEARITGNVIVDEPASPLPVSARIVSITNGGDEPVMRLTMRRGAAPLPGDDGSIAINEAYAEASGLAPGSTLRVLLNGRVESFTVSGIALSPEFVYAVRPGLPIPDDRLFAVIWMDQGAAEAAFDMKGAFNDLAVSLAPGADARAVMETIDQLLEPYGALGTVERRDQPSNRFLEDELAQQKVTSVTVPLIFFGVAAFLLNATLGRLVAAQREQIAVLKALGFAQGPVVTHFLKLVAVVVLLGALAGIPSGILFGKAMIASYQGFFRMPGLELSFSWWSAAAGVAVSLLLAGIGALSSLRSILALSPALAMKPAAPANLRHTWLERAIRGVHLLPSRLIVLRNLAGRPVRTALTITGVALAVPLVVLGLFWRDAIDHMINVQFSMVERGNILVTFPAPLPQSVVSDLQRLPGILVAEGQRVVPVRLRAGHRSTLASVIGLGAESTLVRPHDATLRPITLPDEGLTLSRILADRLGVGLGDAVSVEVLEGARERRDIHVSAIVEEMIGAASYMNIAALNRLTGEAGTVSAASIYADPSMLEDLARRLKDLPAISSVAMKSWTLASFMEKIAGLVLVSAGILTMFGVIIAVGVVYNSVRISLQERAWELASLRVLGFTRGETARILFAGFALETLAGIPLGLVISQLIINLLATVQSNESFQVPSVVGAGTYLLSGAIVMAASLLSAAAVRRRLNALNLVAVLKTRD